MYIFSLQNVIGIVAAVTMDVLSAVSVKLRLIAPLAPRLIGRWRYPRADVSVCLRSLGLASGSPITALGFALCTNVLPWLFMFPAMGYGWFGSHGPTGIRLFRSSL